ncbi:MAG: ABC transporter substrate-binding protein [Rhodospirillales bacterium]|nr:ABC transporter substrate-binding protein [Rhodospirillales bacterium]
MILRYFLSGGFCSRALLAGLTVSLALAATDTRSETLAANHQLNPAFKHTSTQAPILIGLDADMSSASARSGEAIRRGIQLAIDKINTEGGVLGRPFKLIVRDHRGIPARGRDNIDQLGQMQDLLAVVGGIHTPVALHELPLIHKHKLIYLGAWAAGTPVVDNGFNPNYVFRVSVRDQFAGEFLIDAALKDGFSRPGLLLERTGWGRSNEKAILEALEKRGLHAAGVEWFNWGTTDFSATYNKLNTAGADFIMLVCNPREGLIALRDMAKLTPERRIPIISHWGITGGDIEAVSMNIIDGVDLTFLQTFSFLDPFNPLRAEQVFKAYRKAFPDVREPGDIFAPVGTAHAYDLVHLLAQAVEKAGTAERPAVRNALETLGRYEGLVRTYDPPFTATRHDALTRDDFRMARFGRNGKIFPLPRE